MLFEQRRDLFAGLVNSGCDNMAGWFFRKLNNVFTQIGFNRSHARLFERLIHTDLFSHHGLAFGHMVGVNCATQVYYQLCRFVRRTGPVYLPSIGHDLLFKTHQILIKVRQGMFLDGPGLFS